MKVSALCTVAAAAGLAASFSPGEALAGGEVQYGTQTERTVTQTQVAPSSPGVYAPVPSPQPYRYCIPYPYNGPGSYPCAPPPAMTHYAPGGYVYPGYAYAGYGARGMGPGPVLTGGIIGLTLGAIIF